MKRVGHIRLAIQVIILAAWIAAEAKADTSTTLYIGRHFEVRDHEQPVKYVFDGETRLARVTGSLTGQPRVQRLRLFAGWNLCSLAVDVTNFVHQLTNAQPALLNNVLAWDQPTLSWMEVSAAQALDAGSILWIHTAANAHVAVVGSYTDPPPGVVNTNGGFLPAAGLEAWDLKNALSNCPATSAFSYDAAGPGWLLHSPPPLERESFFPAMLSPGSAVFVQAQAPCLIPRPDSRLRIQYYHHDHLGSSSAVTDDEGAIVEETAFYPFGAPRNEFQPRRLHEPYQFTQKERDRESGLHYFEARYQAAVLSRFITPDMKYAAPDSVSDADLAAFLANPQKMNLYAYVLNNPIKLVDPTGLDDKPARRTVLIAYTVDMFTDAQQRMGIPNRTAYHAALTAAYAQEAGQNAQVVFRQLNSWNDLGGSLKGSSFDTVIINTHAFGNDKTMFLGEKKTYDEMNIDRLERFLKGSKTLPKHMFFYGCNTATSGLAGDLSGRFPDTEITGATETIQQTVDKKMHQEKGKEIWTYKINENRDYNKTFKGGNMIHNARQVKIDPNAGLPR